MNEEQKSDKVFRKQLEVEKTYLPKLYKDKMKKLAKEEGTGTVDDLIEELDMQLKKVT